MPPSLLKTIVAVVQATLAIVHQVLPVLPVGHLLSPQTRCRTFFLVFLVFLVFGIVCNATPMLVVAATLVAAPR